MATSASPSVRLRFDNFEIDLRSGELWKQGRRVRLQEQPFQVLRVLLQRRGEIVTREELKQTLWPADTFVDFDDGLNTAVKKIRDVLGDSAERPVYIETIPRRGYRFVAQLKDAVSETSSSEESANRDNESAGKAASRSSATGRFSILSRKMYAGIAAFAAVLVFGAMLYRGKPVRDASPPTVRSLVVLPMKNLSGDPSQEYLADGMTEAIIGRLCGIRGLKVISRTSSMRFKDTTLSAPEIAKTLHVDALVEGSVIREGGRLRVHAQLIRAVSDEHFWSESYDRQVQDVLSLQGDVAQSIARKVEITITGEEQARLVAARSVAPEVYESYLKGRFARKNNKAEVEQSIEYFREAIRKDPSFAPAYAGMANAYDRLGTIIVGAPPDEAREQVIIAARKALELDPGIVEAHALLGDVLQQRWQWGEAETEYKLALDLNPSDTVAHAGYATWLLCHGRLDEALSWARRARELDPLGTSTNMIGWVLFQSRRYDEALQELRSAVAVRPDDATSQWFTGFALLGKGRPEEAIPVLEKTASLMDQSSGVLGVLIAAYAKAGRRSEALRVLDELKKRERSGYVPPGAFVNAYLGLEDYDQAFVWADRAAKEHSNILQFLRVHPFFDPVRQDPRFKDLLRRVGMG